MMKTHTQRAFACLMIPIIHIAAFFVFGFLTTITEFPTNRSGIYLVFSTIDILLMLTFPLVQLGSGIRSIVHQVRALHNQESKVKNGIMMAVSVLFFVAVVLYCYQFWTGIMSV